MLSTETESRLSKMLLILADGEASVEVTRQVLANQIGFDPYNLFRLLDIEVKGWIDSVNIVDFLRRHSIYADSFSAQQIIFHYDADQSGTLSYSEFVNMIVSERNSILRSSSLNSSYRSILPVPFDVEFSLVRLIEKELDFVKCLNSSIAEINLRYDFNVLDAFKSLDVYNIDNINSESIRKFLIRNYITPSESDVANIIKRLDINRDFRVNYSELKSLFSSYSCGVNTSTYSPRRTYYSPFRTRLYCSPRRCYSPVRTYYSPVRTYYSPPRRVQPYTALRSEFLSKSLNRTDLNKSISGSPNRTFLSSSPKRVNSPPRNKSGSNFNDSLSNSGLLTKPDSGFKYPSYEEEVFLNYVRDLISIENSLEINKNEVALKADFNMEDVFSIFEKYNKGYISEFDFKDGLNSYFGLFPTLEEISTLYKRYDTDKLGSLNYGDFFNMLAPLAAEYRRLVENRVIPNSTLVGDPLTVTTKFALKNLISNLVSAEQTLEASRIRMKNMLSFNSKKIFELIGGYASNYFSERDFMLYLDRNNVSYLPKDIELLFIRLSKNKKGLISFSNFLDEISPRY